MFKNLVRERRQQLALSQTKLACMLGIAGSTLSDLELGKRQAWPKIRKALSRVLGVTERELFPEGWKL
ncbi:helix-turn-helix transcriptional regulator [Chloroflexota bacterium]